MKINYKKIILWILFIIVLINLISTPRIFEISYQSRDTYMKSENILPKLISLICLIRIILMKEHVI